MDAGGCLSLTAPMRLDRAGNEVLSPAQVATTMAAMIQRTEPVAKVIGLSGKVALAFLLP